MNCPYCDSELLTLDEQNQGVCFSCWLISDKDIRLEIYEDEEGITFLKEGDDNYGNTCQLR